MKEDEERRAELEDDEMLYTYSRHDAALSQVNKTQYPVRGRGRGRGRSRGVVMMTSARGVGMPPVRGGTRGRRRGFGKKLSNRRVVSMGLMDQYDSSMLDSPRNHDADDDVTDESESDVDEDEQRKRQIVAQEKQLQERLQQLDTKPSTPTARSTPALASPSHSHSTRMQRQYTPQFQRRGDEYVISDHVGFVAHRPRAERIAGGVSRLPQLCRGWRSRRDRSAALADRAGWRARLPARAARQSRWPVARPAGPMAGRFSRRAAGRHHRQRATQRALAGDRHAQPADPLK